jgi:hypothetical protein
VTGMIYDFIVLDELRGSSATSARDTLSAAGA